MELIITVKADSGRTSDKNYELSLLMEYGYFLPPLLLKSKPSFGSCSDMSKLVDDDFNFTGI